MVNSRKTVVVAIVGGGFTGAAVAVHLQKHIGPRSSVRTLVFEPRALLGAGLAYSTDEPANRINVPAERMSLYPDEPDSFVRYLERTGVLAADPEATNEKGQAYPQRGVFGAYVASEVAALLISGAVEHECSAVVHVGRKSDRWTLRTADGRVHFADIVIVASSHPPPSVPKVLSGLAGTSKLVADVNESGAFDAISPDDRVLIVGNGLTAADAFAALKGRGHRGKVLSVSRRGLRSRGHPAEPQQPYGDFLSPPPKTASQLLRRIRLAIAEADQQGATWHGVLDAVRTQGRELWSGFSLAERRRIVRWVRPFWDVHRFRIAPQVERLLDEALAAGDLEILAASPVAANVTPNGSVHVDLMLRGSGGVKTVEVDVVVVTTGPAHDGILRSQSYLADLAGDGFLTACPTGLGIHCDERSRAIDKNALAQETLLIAGPLARGTFGELMGLPQVTEHAVFVAGEVANFVSAIASGSKPEPGERATQLLDT